MVLIKKCAANLCGYYRINNIWIQKKCAKARKNRAFQVLGVILYLITFSFRLGFSHKSTISIIFSHAALLQLLFNNLTHYEKGLLIL
jgi:hypothetical protein